MGMRARWGLVVALAVVGWPAGAHAQTTTQDAWFSASDGQRLKTTLTGAAPLRARPLIVEFSPYGRASGTFDAGAEFNHLLVQTRGTGDSHGSFDVLGPRTQRDVAEVVRWACTQPFSDGRIGLNGFSASAITVYNALHRKLPCVEGAVLRSGTLELYRDLLSPGGVPNTVPGAVVLAGIGGIALAQALDRDPATYLAAVRGELEAAAAVLSHPTLDDWWRERGFRGDVNDIPVLMVAGFFDVESRGAFQAYRALRGDGAHLVVTGAHDAAPKGTDGGKAETQAWFDRHVRGVRNGVMRHPRVQLLLADGDRQAYVDGRFLRRDAKDWPLPATRWRSLYLDPKRSGSALSLNDGTLSAAPPSGTARTPYPALVSNPTQTDVPNAAIIDSTGVSALTSRFPLLSDMRLAEPLGASWTTPPLERDVTSVGPGSLELTLASSSATTTIWAVVSDVSPDGTPHPLTVGRLSTDYPGVDRLRSLHDRDGTLVQPYGRFDAPDPATPGRPRRYQVELWPLGNRFKAGHRIRVHLVGQSAASLPTVPAVNLVTTGGESPARLLLPVVPNAKG